MTKDYVAHAREIDDNARRLAQAAPEVMRALRANRETVYGDGALDASTKELIALAVGIVMRCQGCVTHHTRLAVKKGVSREQLAEMIGVCIQMAGGPAMAFGGEALAAFDQFTDAATPKSSD